LWARVVIPTHSRHTSKLMQIRCMLHAPGPQSVHMCTVPGPLKKSQPCYHVTCPSLSCRGLRAAERTAQLEAARADQAQAQLESAKQEMQQLKDMLQEASSEAAHAKEVAAEREGSGEAERARLARQVGAEHC
jgi:signal transduction histidine kinase